MAVDVQAPPDKEVDTPVPPRRRRNLLSRIWRIYLVRRLVYAVFVTWLVMTGTFFMVRAMPGDPVEVLAGRLSQQGINLEQARQQAKQSLAYDPDAPILQQYWEYLTNLLRGDFGMTISQRGTTVVDHVMEYLPWTLFSVGAGMVIAIVVGMGLGMVMAYRRNGWFDHLLSNIASTLSAIPNYLGAMALILIGSAWLGLFDFWSMRGRLSEGVEPGFDAVFFGDALYHAILPIVTYAFTITGGWMLVMKASTTEVLSEDYVTVANARGLKGRRVGLAYVGRNSVLPLVPQVALALGTLVGGAIIVEQILSYPGVGQLFINAITKRDYPVIQAVVLILTVAVVFSNLVVDMLNSWLDPRIRTGDAEEAGA
ncbi:peptide/nickel transport system permease protein [Stackebrandtia albiflava]|uniref:Peptide/nickel transport system permease protein n=1 Tax=Stackebrandtia albiflava TaxID=406432 RepID=A0A562UXY6_9ACTN|nr:ABC transporter permease [Stackebrandtia albiflava]TWJ10510.1 peptide/nickel transport system permease protein [Stackebrandtia albiflava]